MQRMTEANVFILNFTFLCLTSVLKGFAICFLFKVMKYLLSRVELTESFNFVREEKIFFSLNIIYTKDIGEMKLVELILASYKVIIKER